MGRRSTSTTKSGKFMNPADQERKVARKRELKKNRKQRVMVRSAMLKSKDPDDIIDQLRKLDQVEFDVTIEPTLKKQVLLEKRAKLKGTYFNVLTMFRNEKQNDKVKDMQRLMQQYETERQQIEQNYEAVKFSNDADPSEIPLPDGLALPGASLTPALSAFIPQHLLLPEMSTMHKGILKKTPTSKRKSGPFSDCPPGPPCGLPAEFSDSDDDDEMEDMNTVSGDRRKRVRFGHESDAIHERNYTELDDVSNMTPRMMPPPLMSNAPHVRPLLPSLGPPPRLVGLRPPPPPPYGKPRPTSQMPAPSMGGAIRPPMQVGPSFPQVPAPTNAAVISAEPQVVKRSTTGATISAQPVLRDMKRESIQFVPTNLRVHRASTIQDKKSAAAKIRNRTTTTTTASIPGVAQLPPQKTTDDAYSEFMREMSGLL